MEKILLKSKILIESKSVVVRRWSLDHLPGLFIFNIFLMLEMLLYTAGYFSPFFSITINLIVLTSLILSIFILGVRSKVAFMIAIFFWCFAGILQILQISVWAERTTIYAYEALVVGIILLIFESRNLIK